MTALLVVGMGCSASHDRSATPSTTRPSTTTLTRPVCSTPTHFGLGDAVNEIRGASNNAQMWGLVLGPGHIPPRAGDELKIVWRMPGTGPLRIAFTAPDGHQQPLVFGPEAHSASSYHRPGDEWGTGFRFVMQGCWHIHLARDDTSGDVWLHVGAAP